MALAKSWSDIHAKRVLLMLEINIRGLRGEYTVINLDNVVELSSYLAVDREY